MRQVYFAQMGCLYRIPLTGWVDVLTAKIGGQDQNVDALIRNYATIVDPELMNTTDWTIEDFADELAKRTKRR